MVYHAWHYGQIGTNGRAMLLDEVVIGADGWPAMAHGSGTPTYTPEPVPL